MPVFIKRYFEQFCWAVALVCLYYADVSPGSASFCIFKMIGFDSCMGCGIGHAIHYALHLDFLQSYHEHIMGIPAVFLLIYKVFSPFLKYKNKYYGSTTAHDVKRVAG